MKLNRITKDDLRESFFQLFIESYSKHKTERWFTDDETFYKTIFNNYIDKLMEYICQNVNETTEKNTMNTTQVLNKRNEEQKETETEQKQKKSTVKKPSKEKKLTMWAAIEQGTYQE